MLKIFEFIFGKKEIKNDKKEVVAIVADSVLIVNGEEKPINHPVLRDFNFDFEKLDETEQNRLVEILGNNNAILSAIDEEIITKAIIK